MTNGSPFPTIDLDNVIGGRGGRLWPLVRDGFTAAMSYFTGEQVPEINRPQPERPGITDSRPPPQPPALPRGVRIRR